MAEAEGAWDALEAAADLPGVEEVVAGAEPFVDDGDAVEGVVRSRSTVA